MTPITNGGLGMVMGVVQSAFSGVSQERRIAELTVLYEVSHALQKTVDEDKALHTILLGLTHGRGLGFNRAFILLVDSDERHLRGRLAVGPSTLEEASSFWQPMRDTHSGLGELLSSLSQTGIKRDLVANEIVSRFDIPLSETDHPLIQIMRSHESCLPINGILEPSGLPVPETLVTLLGTSHFVVTPIYLADRDLGVIIADNAISRAPIDMTSLRLLEIYAQQAGAAIQNTRLYKELTEKISLCENANLTLRENQYHLLRAERLSVIGKMAALLAHEIRTPLVSIGGFARRLLRTMATEDGRREEMEIIVSEVSRLERLVMEVLGYARLARPEYKPLDINGLIKSMMVTMQEEIERNLIKTVYHLAPDLPLAQVDESQLRQALMNLVTNAIDAMPSGGTLRIETSAGEDSLEIGVSDTGSGISHEHWDKLFTPFFTTKVMGTGLGLAIVSQVIENHCGTLRFESIPDQGTSFHIRLALHPEGPQALSATSLVGRDQKVRL